MRNKEGTFTGHLGMGGAARFRVEEVAVSPQRTKLMACDRLHRRKRASVVKNAGEIFGAAAKPGSSFYVRVICCGALSFGRISQGVCTLTGLSIQLPSTPSFGRKSELFVREYCCTAIRRPDRPRM